MGTERNAYFRSLPKHLTYQPVTRVKIGTRWVGENEPVFVIAEISANHRQKIETAFTLIDKAKDAGADAVKFQHYTGTTIAADTHIADRWHGKPIGNLSEHYGRSSMPYEWTERLAAYAKKRGIMFLSSPFDKHAVDLLEKAKIPAYKIASYELTSDDLLRYVARTGKPIILSTGMTYLEEVAHAVRVIQEEGNNDIVLLHCVSMYPVNDFSLLNLKAISTLHEAFNVPVGFSDHTAPPWSAAAVAAVALGACVIEKHLTNDAKGGSIDDTFSIMPHDFKRMIEEIRHAEAALSGNGIKQPVSVKGHRGDEVFDRYARRSLYATQNIRKGTVVTKAMIQELRPFGGIEPMHAPLIIGRKVVRDVEARAPLTWEDFLL